jgi:NDP-sugar pyrophosphorylase family protein
MQPTLLILAAGMGSRYGGLKQLDPMGPNGETVLDYSVHDAIQAGFGKVVFVIRRDFFHAFKSAVADKFEARIQVAYVFQELSDLPQGFSIPTGRKKPWGTAHAVRAARKEIDTPFAVINADDFYGRDAYLKIADYFKQQPPAPELRSCMVGYPLKNTLSEHGSVNRGICHLEKNTLRSVEEHSEIKRQRNDYISGLNMESQAVVLPLDAVVSMNFWGFTPLFFMSLEAHFIDFLKAKGLEMESECYIPSVVDQLIQSQQTDCMVLKTEGAWFGVTYPQDKAIVQSKIQALLTQGAYPSTL